MNVHMRKLDDSVFVDVVYSIKNFFGLNIMSILHFHKYHFYYPDCERFEKLLYIHVVAPVQYIPIYDSSSISVLTILYILLYRVY